LPHPHQRTCNWSHYCAHCGRWWRRSLWFALSVFLWPSQTTKKLASFSTWTITKGCSISRKSIRSASQTNK
jgi:hypothetical protein